MAHYSTPFIIVNLGCEMLYVVDQRLKAQQIPNERAAIVLTDITSILLNVQLLDDLFLPQPVPDHGVIKQLLQDISASSIMKLDDFSWNKLWDLMSVLFKWQMSVCLTDVFDITSRHLDGVYKLLDSSPAKELCVASKKKFTTLHSKITANDLIALTEVLRDWLNPYCCKISVLLRLGLQKSDASFTEIGSSIDNKFLQSLGSNIYNFDCKSGKENTASLTDTNEVSFYVNQFKKYGEKSDEMVTLRLPIQLESGFTKETIKIKKSTICEAIETQVRKKTEDLVFCQEDDKSMQQQLLDMLQ